MAIDELIGRCPDENGTKRTFTRIDNGIAIIGKYQCNGCGEIYREYQLGIGDIATRIGEKLSKQNGR